MRSARGSEIAFWVVAVLVASAAVSATWVVDYIPTNDGPEHVLHSYLVNEWRANPSRLGLLLEANPSVSGHGFSMLLTPLERVLPWRTALRVAQSIIVLSWGAGLLALAWALDRRRRWLGIAAFATCFNGLFYFGFFEYYMAQAVGFGVLAVTWRARHRTRQLALWTGFGLLVVAVGHTFAAIVTGVLLVALVVPAQEPARRWAAFWATAAASVPAALIAALTFFAPIVAGPTDSESTPGLWSQIGDIPAYAFALPSWGALVLFAFSLFALGGAFWHWREPALRGRRQLAVASAGFVVLSLVVPFSVPGWQVISPRLLVVGLTLGWLAVPVEVWNRGRVTLQVIGVALALGSLGLASWRHTELRAQCGAALSALDLDVPEGTGIRVALFLQDCSGANYCTAHRDAVPRGNATDHLGALFAVTYGGVPNRFFHGYRGVHPFVIPDSSPLRVAALDEDWQALSCRVGAAGDSTGEPDPVLQEFADEVGKRGAFADSLYLYGDGVQAVAPLLERRGYHVLLASNPHLLARFEGCRASVALPEAWRSEGTTRLEYGWFPNRAVFAFFDWAGPNQPSSPTVPLPRAPCGPIWIRAEHHSDQGGEAMCRGAVDGYLAMDVEPPESVLRCDPVPVESDGAPLR